MRHCEKNKERGAILIVTLIFLFILTLIVVSDTTDFILNTKMQSAMQNHFLMFARAEAGVQEMVSAIMGAPITLPDSSISLNATAKIIKTDHCGNQIIFIQSIAQNHEKKIILNSLHIFARVPKLQECEQIAAHQIIWWEIR